MKTTKEKIAVMQAHLDGKIIQSCMICSSNQSIWLDCPKPSWSWNCINYRVKPEPKSVPLTSAEDLVGKMVRAKKDSRWVRLICECRPDYATGEMFVGLGCNGGKCSLQQLCDGYTFLDGSPCGTIVKE